MLKFVDEAKIKIVAGHGGSGCVSFRRETFVPRGGPDGGDGGEGGSVYLIADLQCETLQDLKLKRRYHAQRGSSGSSALKSGKDGANFFIKVPVGTSICNEFGELIEFLKTPGQTWLAAKGGRGGKGNTHFKSSTFQAPRFAQSGEEGESLEVTLVLQLLADIGIIGQPNAGKSTFLSSVSSAKPKIGAYPFTTLIPQLGVIHREHLFESWKMVDIPGIVEGAHRGKGLGHRFLKHIQKTKILLHCVSVESFELDPKTIFDLYDCTREELKAFDPTLCDRPEIILLTKSDLLSEKAQKKIQKTCQQHFQKEVHLVSALEPQSCEKVLKNIEKMRSFFTQESMTCL